MMRIVTTKEHYPVFKEWLEENTCIKSKNEAVPGFINKNFDVYYFNVDLEDGMYSWRCQPPEAVEFTLESPNKPIKSMLKQRFPKAPPELDSRGFPWDERIHASSKQKLHKKDVWRGRRGIETGVVEQVEAELRQRFPKPPEAPQLNEIKQTLEKMYEQLRDVCEELDGIRERTETE